MSQVFLKSLSSKCQVCAPTAMINRSTFRRFISIFNIHQLVDVFKVTFKRREYNIRSVILTLLFLMLINVTIFSDGGVLYLYARKEFHWDEQMFTKFQTCSIGIMIWSKWFHSKTLSFSGYCCSCLHSDANFKLLFEAAWFYDWNPLNMLKNHQPSDH